jgi:hypothetical protein
MLRNPVVGFRTNNPKPNRDLQKPPKGRARQPLHQADQPAPNALINLGFLGGLQGANQ